MRHFFVTLLTIKRNPFVFLLSTIFVILNGSTSGANEKGSSRLKFATYNASTNNSLFLEDNKISAIYSNINNAAALGFFDQSYKNTLVLGIDRTITNIGTVSALLPSNIFRAEVDVQIVYNQLTPSGNTFITNISTLVKTLKINFSGFNAHVNGSAPTTEIDLDAFNYNNGYQSIVTITAVRIYNSANSLISGTNVPQNIYLELQSDAERYYELNTNSATPYSLSSAVVITPLNGVATGNEFEVKWARINGAEEYELEWLWLDEFTYGNGAVPANPSWNNFPALDFKHNSTRIRTDQNNYRISNIYESGHLFVRVRAVGRCKTPASLIALGNDIFCDCFTNWTWPDNYAVPAAGPPAGATGGGMIGTNLWPHFVDLRTIAHEQTKNWVYKASYAEEGKKSEVISYFDGAQYSRQTVTKNNSDNIALVSETYYDFLGRASAQALPTPVADATIKFYQQTVAGKTAFNFDAVTDSAFTKRVFALASGQGQCALTSGGFDSNYGTGKYYSGNNTFQSLNYNNGYLPKGENYPFTQTEYTPDNTGRVARQSGLGPTFKLENAVGVNKHDTRHFYGSVSQEELDRLFGSEAGYASHYTKNMAIDGNGQASLSYLDQAGKVVATALSGARPANLQPLLAANGVTDLSASTGIMELDLLNKPSVNSPDTPNDNNQLNSNELVYNDKLLVTSAQTYYFDYSLKGSSFNGCGNFNYDCVYDLEFDITDVCGNRPTGFNPISYTLGKITGTSPNFISTTNFDNVAGNDAVNFKFRQILPPSATSLAVALDIGEYTITKRLKVNQAALQAYLADYLQNCATPPGTFDANEQLNLNTAGCEMDCKECAAAVIASLGTLQNYIAANPNLTAQEATNQYNGYLKECYEPCSYDSYCETAKEAMLSDMTPGGQYAEYYANNGTIDASPYPLSIFNPANALPRSTQPGSASWKNPVHYAIAPVNGASGYLDEFGQPDRVSVFETAQGSGVYVPPVAVNSILGPGPGINEFYAKPEGLTNISDFITNFKPSWAESLLKYHPEYAYVEWCLKNGQAVTSVPVKIKNYDFSNPLNIVESGPPTLVNITSSDHYDSLYTSIDDLGDISTAALASPYNAVTSIDILLKPLSYDPYWNSSNGNARYYISGTATSPALLNTGVPNPNNPAQNNASAPGAIPQLLSISSAVPADFTGYPTMYPQQKSNKSANNRFFNYKETGLSLYQYAALMASGLLQQYGQPTQSLLSTLKTAVYYPGLSPAQITAMGPNDPNWILALQKPGTFGISPLDDSYLRLAWETFKTSYLVMKQELQQEAAQSYVMNGPSRGCNNCIGRADFEVKSVKYTTYLNDVLPSLLYAAAINSNPFNTVSPIISVLNLITDMIYIQKRTWYEIYDNSLSPYNKDQVCGLATKDLYLNKTKRFYVSEDALALLPGGGNGANNTQAAIYAQTGLCPNAYDLRNFLNAMVGSGNSLYDVNKNLSSTVPAFSQGLYQAVLQNNTIPVPFVNAVYNYVNSNTNGNKTLMATINIGGSSCNITLNLPATVPGPIPVNTAVWGSYPSIYKINQFVNFAPIAGAGNFQVDAIVSTLGANPVLYTITLTGNACNIPLSGCSFVPPCKTNGLGKALNVLLNAFVSNGTFPAPFNGTTYQAGNLLTPAPRPYASAFVNSFKPLLEMGAPVNSWQWAYNAAQNEITISDGSTANTNKRLKITFTAPYTFLPGPNSSNTAPSLACIQSFQNFQPDPAVAGGFVVEGLISNINAANVSCQSGTLIIKGLVAMGEYISNAYVYTPLEIGRCGFDLYTCSTKEHEAKRDLEKWVLNTPVVNPASVSFVNMVTSSTPVNISNRVSFSPLLRSYLNSAVSTNANGPIQNFYHWVPDAANSNNNQICGWITVSQSQTAPNPVPAGSCYFTIKKIVPPNSPINPNSISSLLTNNVGTLFKLKATSNNNTNIYSFKLLSDNFNTDDSLICTTTCFPMKDCEMCTSTTQQNPGPTNAITIENFNGTPTFNLSHNGIPYSLSNPSPFGGFQPNNFSEYIIAYVGYSTLSANTCNGSQGFNNSFPYNLLVFSPSPSAMASGIPTIFIKNFSVPASGFYNLLFDYILVSLSFSWNVYINNTLVGVINNGSWPLIINSVYLNTNMTNQFKLVMNHPTNCYLAGIVVGPIKAQLVTPSSSFLVPCVNNDWPTDTMPTTNYEEPCAPYLQDLIDNTADEKYDAYLEGLKAQFMKNYTQFCLSNANENLKMKYNNTDYHYTLYYYDQAGNLVRTVPPQGVKPIALGSIYTGSQTNGAAIREDRSNFANANYTKKIYTKHTFLTTYTYNSLNQLVRQETPDAGISKFYYDNLGRLVASQNAEQKFQSTQLPAANQKYSYTRYDVLGRITLVGQLGTYDLDSYPGIPPGQTVKDLISAVNYPFNLSIAANSHVQVTETVYGDDPTYSPLVPGTFFATGQQRNLRGRVASATIEEVYDGSRTTFDYGTHYSYDIHGNVKELVQHNPELYRFNYINSQTVKRLEYSYDLISGKVNAVIYQKNEPDMFMHKYLYDAANRITNVYTSRDGIIWDQDAKYFYYPHGPLARTELGEHKVQSNDYAYTLQGWLKGVNSEGLKADRDMGKDGYSSLGSNSNAYNLNRYNGRDAYGYALNYYTNTKTNTSVAYDYLPINGANATPSSYFLANLGTTYGITQLFNGNITALSASYLNPSPTPINLTSLTSAVAVNKYDPYTFMKLYTYDQLNRIRSARTGAKAINAGNNWMYTSLGNLAAEFSEDFKYDQNGNILKADRSLIGGSFDKLVYYYYAANGTAFNPVSPPANTVPTNKLAYVTDTQGSSVGDMGNQTANNYTYDKIGNLITDAAENISSIGWTVYGKIKSIKRNITSKPDLEFRYDAMGNRIAKRVVNTLSGMTTITYYVRDAQGNIMATYDETVIGTAKTLRLTELNLFGSSRLGTRSCNAIIGYNVNGLSTTITGMISAQETNRTNGLKSYELSNHLGNVLAVVSDRKLAVDDGVYNASGVKTSSTPDGICDYFYPDVLSATDYYAFGSPMPGRQFNNGSYRYGFNGKENDPETVGTGQGTQDYGLRIYNPALGRFLSIDPLSRNFPWFSPYHFAGNTPIQAIDLEGAEVLNKVYVKVDEQGTTFLTNPNGSKVMETTNGHNWSGQKDVKAYFVYKKGTSDYKFYDSNNPGEAEAKMRAEGVKFGNPEITENMMKSPSKYGPEVERAKRTAKNYVTGVLLPVAAESFIANPSVLEGASILLDTDELVGGAVDEDSAIESALPSNDAKAKFNMIKGAVDMSGRTSDILNLNNVKSGTDAVKTGAGIIKGTADVTDDATSAQEQLKSKDDKPKN